MNVLMLSIILCIFAFKLKRFANERFESYQSCHCIVELKAHRLDYADVAQLNMYIEYYRKHYMQPDDNPPVGLLLCTECGQEMVEYLTPFTDPQLFVARYELQLPSKEKIRKFLMQENGNTKR